MFFFLVHFYRLVRFLSHFELPSKNMTKRQKVLGSGAYGEVVPYLKDTVVKTFKEGVCTYSQIREIAFYRYLEDSPGVIKFEGFGARCIFLQRALHDMNQFVTLDSDSIDRYVVQILETLAELHKRCVLHRDLKLSNLLVDQDNRVRFCDLGSFRMVSGKSDQLELTNPVCTLDSRAPEIVLGSTSYTDKSDVWSLGICILSLYCHKSRLTNIRDHDNEKKTRLEMLRWFCVLCGYPEVKRALWHDVNFQELLPKITHQLYRYQGTDFVWDDTPKATPPRRSLDTNDLTDVFRPRQFSSLVKYLLSRCLVMDPNQRASCHELLCHVRGQTATPELKIPTFFPKCKPASGIQKEGWKNCYRLLNRFQCVSYSTLFLTARLVVHSLKAYDTETFRCCLYLASQIYEDALFSPRYFKVTANQVYAVLLRLNGRVLVDHEQLYIDLWQLGAKVSETIFESMENPQYFELTPMQNIQKFTKKN